MTIEPEFDILKDSETLKELVSIYDSESFIKHIADIISLIQPTRIPFKPFVGLDSPLIQLFYIANLNITSSPDKIKKQNIEYEEWFEIVKYAIRIKAGYYDALLPTANDDEVEFYEKYKIVMPVFVDYFNSGTLNFEEQEIAKIESIFLPFDNEIETKYGLKIKDFLDIYTSIDNYIQRNFNLPLQIIASDSEAKAFWDKQKKDNIPPDNWSYTGDNGNIKRLIELFEKPLDRYSLKKSDLLKDYPNNEKLETFLSIFSIQRAENAEYKFYTSPVSLLRKPIFNIDNENFIILEIKQIITAVYRELTEFGKTIEDRFYKRRGKFLQESIVVVLKQFFGESALIFNEYKTSKLKKGQDVLLLYKGLALIIEAKAGREPEPRRDANVKESFKTITTYFKKNIQKAYEQADRIKELFDIGEDFDIIDDSEKILYNIRTNKYHSVFSIIITLDKFREAQINLNHLLELNEGDENYPISLCIDDFETLLLALKKRRTNIPSLIKYLKNRQELQGRIDANDELQIWADFLLNDNFKVPDNPNLHYVPSVLGADLFDDLYESGLGFKREKFMEQKKNKQIFSHREYIKKHYAQHAV